MGKRAVSVITLIILVLTLLSVNGLMEGFKTESREDFSLLTYTNEDYGISFQYPEYLDFFEDPLPPVDRECVFWVRFFQKDSEVSSSILRGNFRVCIYKGGEESSLIEFVKAEHPPTSRHYLGQPTLIHFGDMPEALMIPTLGVGLNRSIYVKTESGRVLYFAFLEDKENQLQRIIENTFVSN